GLPAVAMAWGPWEAAGMTEQLDRADRARMTSSGICPLSPAQGLELFDAALAGEQAIAVLTRLDMAALRTRAKAGTLPDMLQGLTRSSSRRVASVSSQSDS